MTEVIGDIVKPSNLILRRRDGTFSGSVGEIFISGAKLWFTTQGRAALVTSV